MKYKMQLQIIIILSLISNSYLFAQEQPRLDLPRTNYSAVPPEVAKFGKYGNVPVDLSTGRINYDIPLYTIEVNGSQFPISLSYNFNGLKNEIPGSAGVGWDLMVGGSLAVQSKGGNDGNYTNHIEDEVLPVLNNPGSCFPEEFGDKLLYLMTLPNAITNGNVGDTEPDEFVISSPYISGTFYENHLEEYVFIPHKSYKVNKQESNGFIQGYSVLDDSGTEYQFQQRNAFSTNIEGANGEDFTTPSVSYKLNQINLPFNSGSLSFSYNESRPFASLKRTYSSTYKKLNTNGQIYESNSISNNASTASSSGSEELPTQILFPNGELNFKYNDGRVEEMEVWKVSIDGIKSLLLKYKFIFGNDDYLLEEIIKESGSGNEQPFYSFRYHSPIMITDLGEGDLGTDAWGFLNGMPHTYPKPGLVNKLPVFDNALPGALAEIRYPTGGSTLIEYEANTVNGTLYPYDASNKFTTTYDVQEDARASTPDTNRDVQTFTINGQTSVEAYYSFVLPDFVSGDVSITNNANQQVVFSRDEDDASGNPSGNAILNLSAGTYTVIAEIEGQTPATAYISVRGNPQLTYNPDFVIGGIRVKQTIDCPDGALANCIYRNYQYKNPILLDNPVLNYDILIMEQNNNQVIYEDGGVFITNNQASFSTYKGSHILYKTVEILEGKAGANGKKVLSYSGSDNNNFTDTEPPFVPYLKKDWEKGKLIKEEVYKYEENDYIKVKETVNTYEPVYPFHEPTTTFANLSQGENADKIAWGFVSTQYKSFPNAPISVAYNCVDQLDYYLYESYAYLPQRYDLISTVITQDSVIESVFYEYDDDYGQVVQIENLTDLEGAITTYSFQYPYDLDGSLFSGLLVENRINQPVISEVKYDEFNKEITKVNYGLTESNQILPLELVQEKSESAPIIKMRYDGYTDNGKVSQYTNLVGPSKVFIWGYYNQLPVIKVENNDYTTTNNATVASLPSEYSNIDDLLLDLDGIQTNAVKKQLWKSFNISLREALPSTMVTTYTHEPLVGLTSMTDPRGYTMYYEYDEFNRLKAVKDADGNLVTDYEYGYKQPVLE